MESLNIVPSVFFQPVSSLANGGELTRVIRTAPLREVIKTMAEKNIGCVVVTEYDKPVGIFTERDLMKKIVGKPVNLDKDVIEQHMTANPVCISGETEIIRAMHKMHVGKFRHLVLTDTQGMVTGVISIRDLLGYLFLAISDAMGDEKAEFGL